ncbi:unnamed protein product [Cladocopium goreaui]|uniref:Uncharacterized protein n=1 Tax=Cladocopium goreaui TaxID=2562237 RepID=A0A9P1C0P0_9DINO|nr:unnamed protein product [Cladocopium goreaui]
MCHGKSRRSKDLCHPILSHTAPMGLQKTLKALLAFQLVWAVTGTPIKAAQGPRIRLSWEADIGSDLDLSKGLATHAFERLQGPSAKVLQPVYFKFLEHYGRVLLPSERAEVKVPACKLSEWSPVIGVDSCSN